MGSLILRRVAQGLLVVLALSMLIFVGLYAVGDPTTILLDPQSTPEDIARFRSAMGLDQPLWRQYLLFLFHLVQGSWGTSFVYHQSAMDVILERLPATLELAVTAMVLAVAVGVPLGVLAGATAPSRLDRWLMTGSIFGFSLPTFWVGLVLIVLFAVDLGWLPASGRGATISVLGVGLSVLTTDGVRHILLPALNLSLFPMALVLRLSRSGVREAMGQDFVRYARAKGLSSTRILVVHVLKRVAIPVVTVSGLQFGNIIAFSVVTESVFAWPGTGKLIIDSINQLDRPVVVGYLVIIAVLFVAINLVVDLLYAALDPRARLRPA
ncbi:MAG TPA: ABC transporter permease [Acetobacteraceae bacterium]